MRQELVHIPPPHPAHPPTRPTTPPHRVRQVWVGAGFRWCIGGWAQPEDEHHHTASTWRNAFVQHLIDIASAWDPMVHIPVLGGLATAAPDLPKQRDPGLGALGLVVHCASHLRVSAKRSFRVHQKLGKHSTSASSHWKSGSCINCQVNPGKQLDVEYSNPGVHDFIKSVLIVGLTRSSFTDKPSRYRWSMKSAARCAGFPQVS